jgi:uncharacterized membrane protein YdjX (TVP38/TMEM64 family)
MVNAVRVVTLIALIIACILFYPYLTPQNISVFISQYGVAAPLLFIGVCAVRPILFFLPSMGLTIIAGILFGAVWGTVYVALGGVISTAVGYYFARWIGRDAVRKLVAGNAALMEWEKKAHNHPVKAVLLMRLFNLPWDLVSYWAGLQGIGFRDFYMASLILLIPVSFLYTYFGSTVFDPFSVGFLVSLAIIIIMGAAPFIRARWNRKAYGG